MTSQEKECVKYQELSCKLSIFGSEPTAIKESRIYWQACAAEYHRNMWYYLSNIIGVDE